MQTRAPDVFFLLVGEGADKERIIGEARSHGLKNIRFIDQQPRINVPAYIAASDACMVLLKKNDIFKTVIPTKMLEFMSCARPVILAVDGQARKILQQAHSGIVIPPEDATALANAITLLAENQTLSHQLGQNGRHYVLQNFSRRQTAAEYIAVLEELLDGTRKQRARAA